MIHQTETLLIVEDVLADLEQYSRWILDDTSYAYCLLKADSAAAGLELCRTQSIDAVLINYALPDANGLEFLAALSAQNQGNSPPVVMITEAGDQKTAVQAIKLGAEDYLIKHDLTLELLQSTLQSAIENARLRRQLQQRTDRFRASVENMLDCFGFYSAIRDASGQISDFRFDYLNAAALENNRMTIADMDRGLCELFPAVRETGLFDQYCEVIATGIPLVKEDLSYSDLFGGQRLTRAYNVQISKLDDGFVASWRDITDPKQLELARIQAEQERDRFFNLSTDLLAIANFEGYFLRLNPAWEKILGFTFAELMGQPYLDLVHPEDLDNTLSCSQVLSEGEVAVNFENRYRCTDGSYRWLSWSATPFAEQNLIYAIARDITERKRSEALIQESEHKFSAVFNQTFELVGLLSLDGVVLEANQTALASINALQTDIVGQNVWETPWWKHSPQLQQQLKDAITTAASGQLIRYEMQFPNASGALVAIDFSLKPVFDESGRVMMLLAEGHDITERNRIQTVLEERNQELDSFVHIVSHDLKAPLRGISNLSQWIEEDLAETLSKDTQGQMSLLRDRVHRMEAMIDGLLDYARAGQTDTKVEQFESTQLLAEVIDSIAPSPSFTISIAPELPVLSTSRLLLSQVFNNLISNGIKHHDQADGSIFISCQERGDFYEFLVADDGPGIAPKHQEQVFKIFQAINPQNRADSTGVGLAIVKKIVEAEGGHIWLESELGQGTKFYFTWPKALIDNKLLLVRS